MRRLLHVYSGNLYGGIEAILVSLVRHRGLRPDLTHEFALCFEGRLGGELDALGATVHRLGEVRASRPYTIRRARLALRGLLAARRFDRVICHAPWAQALFGGVARRAGVPLVFWMHDAATGGHWTERWARRTAPDLAICNSRYTAGTLPALYPAVPAAVVYAPVDVTSEPLSPAERRAMRAQTGTPEPAIVVVQASRMQAWKGHQTVLEALGRLRGRADWVWWVVGGAQRPAEAAYVETLRALAHRLGVADRVRWLGERHDVGRLLSAADLYCQANAKAEPFGIVFIEAMAAGLPVIASRAGGAIEIVDETCGVLVAPGDAVALAGALEQLAADRALRAKLGASAPQRARRLCDPSTQLERLAGVLTEMTASGCGA